MSNVCVNVLSLNVRGIRDLNKPKLIFAWVKNETLFFFCKENLVRQIFLIVGNISVGRCELFTQIKSLPRRCGVNSSDPARNLS